MQTLGWYVRRLGAQPLWEIGWRIGGAWRDVIDWACYRGYQRPFAVLPLLTCDSTDRCARLGRLSAHLHEDNHATASPLRDGWRTRLVEQAERILGHWFSILHYPDVPLGDKVNWNRDPMSGKRAPLGFARYIGLKACNVDGAYRYLSVLNRHHQLVVLGRAYRATGDRRFARGAVNQWMSWLDACPYGMGLNWQRPTEQAIRLINWVCAYELIDGPAAFEKQQHERFLRSVYLHLHDISRHYGRPSRPPCHLIAEAAGVFTAASYFSGLKRAAAWRRESQKILAQQIMRQTFEDGSLRAQSAGYQLLLMDLLVMAGLVARRLGDDFDEDYWQRLERMFSFVAGRCETNSPCPSPRDGDVTRLLDIGGQDDEVRSMLAVGAILFDRPDFKLIAQDYREPAYWLFGTHGKRRFDALSTIDPTHQTSHRTIEQTGS